MIKKALLSILGLVATANAVIVDGQHLNTGSAGGIQLFGNITSLNHMIDTLAAVVPASALQKKNFTIDFQRTIAGFDISTEYIYIENFLFATHSLTWNEDRQMLRLTLGGLNANGTMRGSMVSPLHKLPATATAWSVSNVTLLVDFMTYPGDDNVHWSLDEYTNITFGDINFEFEEPFWNMMMHVAKKDFLELVNFGAWMAEGALNGAVQALNVMIENEVANPDTFNANLFGQIMNFTMTRFPEINNDKLYITVNADGRAIS